MPRVRGGKKKKKKQKENREVELVDADDGGAVAVDRRETEFDSGSGGGGVAGSVGRRGAVEEGLPPSAGKLEAFKRFEEYLKRMNKEGKSYVLEMSGREFEAMRDQVSAKLEEQVMLYGKPIPKSYTAGDLMAATIAGDREAVVSLLKAGLNPNTQQEQVGGSAPLHFAARHGHTEIVADLLAHEADPKRTNRMQETALMLAAFWAHAETLSVLHQRLPSFTPDACVVPADHPLACGSFDAPGTQTIIASAPEFGAGVAGFEVLRQLQDICTNATYKDRVCFGYALGGPANIVDPSDADDRRVVPLCCQSIGCICPTKSSKTRVGRVDWRDPASVAGSRWFNNVFKVQLQDCIETTAALPGVKTIEVVTISGSGASQLEMDSTPGIITNACARVSAKGGSISTAGSDKKTTVKVMFRPMSYVDFFTRVFGPRWREEHESGQHSRIVKTGTLTKGKETTKAKVSRTSTKSRVVAVVERGGQTLASRFFLTYGEGVELLTAKNKGEIPLFGARMTFEPSGFSLTVSKKHWPEHKNAGVPITFGVPKAGAAGQTVTAEMDEWQNSLQLANIPLADGWEEVFATSRSCSILKSDHFLIDPALPPGGLANRRLVAMYSLGDDSPLKERFCLGYAEGDRTMSVPSELQASTIPLFGATISKENGRLDRLAVISVTVSEKFFPGHAHASTPFLLRSENTSTMSAAKELEGWFDAMQMIDVPILGSGWQQQYEQEQYQRETAIDAQGCTIIKEGHTAVDCTAPLGALGNRRLVVLTKTLGNLPLSQLYFVRFHDGIAGTDVTPTGALPLFRAQVTLTETALTVQPLKGSPLVIQSEKATAADIAADLASWQQELQVKDVEIFPARNWLERYSKTHTVEIVKWDYTAIDPRVPLGAYGNRRLCCLVRKVDKAQVKMRRLDLQYYLFIHEGDEPAVNEMAPKVELPLFRAKLAVTDSTLTVEAVSCEPVVIRSEMASQNGQTKDLQEWTSACEVVGVDVFQGDGWQSQYAQMHNVQLLKCGHTRISEMVRSGQYGNRRLCCLTRSTEEKKLLGGLLSQRYSLAIHELGDMKKADQVVSLFGAFLEVDASSLTITPLKGKSVILRSELEGPNSAQDLDDWKEALHVRGVPIFEGDWKRQYEEEAQKTVIAACHAQRDFNRVGYVEALGHRRLTVLTKDDAAALLEAYNLEYHDGEGSFAKVPKGSLPLFGADMQVDGGILQVTVSAEFFPKHFMAGKQFILSAETKADTDGLVTWISALNNVPLFQGTDRYWQQIYARQHRCELVKVGYLRRSMDKPAGALGNRILLLLTKSAEADVTQRFNLLVHDGSETTNKKPYTDQGNMTPKEKLPLYLAQVTLSGGALTVAAAGRPKLTMYSEDSDSVLADLQSWMDALLVKNVDSFSAAWRQDFAAKMKCVIVKDGYMRRDSARAAGSLGNRRQLMLIKTEEDTLKDALKLAYVDDGDTEVNPNHILPLWGAMVEVVFVQEHISATSSSVAELVVTVSTEHFPEHSFAGTAVVVGGSEGEGEQASAALASWCEATLNVPMFDGAQRQWAQPYQKANNCEILKVGYLRRSTDKEPGALGNRLLLVLVKDAAGLLTVAERYFLYIHNGSESSRSMEPAEKLALYMADVVLTADNLRVDDKGGKSVSVFSEDDGTDLRDWAEALQVKNVGVFEGSGAEWRNQYGKRTNCSVVKEGHVVIDTRRTVNSLGNRRLLMLTKTEEATLMDAYQLHYADGDEDRIMKPKETLPLYGADIQIKAKLIEVAISRKHFPSHAYASKTFSISCESDADLQVWAETLLVKGVAVASAGWQQLCAGTPIRHGTFGASTPATGALGTRRHFAICKFDHFESPFDQGNHALWYYDGTEKREAARRQLLPTFDGGVVINKAKKVLTFTVSQKEFPQHESAGVKFLLCSEKPDEASAARELQDWADAILKTTGAIEWSLRSFSFRATSVEDVKFTDEEGFTETIANYGCFDENGALNFLATRSKSKPWQNPCTDGIVRVELSSAASNTTPANFVTGPKNGPIFPGINATKNEPNSWMRLDLGAGRRISITHYALRHDATEGMQSCQLRNWELQGSSKAEGPWTTLKCVQRKRGQRESVSR